MSTVFRGTAYLYRAERAADFKMLMKRAVAAASEGSHGMGLQWACEKFYFYFFLFYLIIFLSINL